MDEGMIEHDPGADPDLLSRLIHAVTAGGGNIQQAYSGIAGEHRIVVYEIMIWEALLTFTSETGAGSLLKGPREPVERLARLLMGSSTVW